MDVIIDIYRKTYTEVGQNLSKSGSEFCENKKDIDGLLCSSFYNFYISYM